MALRLYQALQCRVGAAVVDEDELEGETLLGQDVGVLAYCFQKRRNRVFFIVHRNDDGNRRCAILQRIGSCHRRPVVMQKRRVHRLPLACRFMDVVAAETRKARLS